MAEDMTYEPVQTVAQLAARVQELERENAELRARLDWSGEINKAYMARQEEWVAETQELRARIEQLTLIIGVIDERMGLADATCDEPGITVSEAAKRVLADAGMIDYAYNAQSDDTDAPLTLAAIDDEDGDTWEKLHQDMANYAAALADAPAPRAMRDEVQP